MSQCTAKSKTTGQRCKRSAVSGSTVCRYHGGLTPKGIASPHFKDGRYSKYIPARLLERYQQSVDDPELLNLRQDIALLDSRLSNLLERVDTGEARSLWEKARKVNQDIQKAVHDENYGRMMVQCLELDRLIGDAMVDHEAWYEVQSLIEQRRKLVESEQKRLVAMQQMVTAEQAMTLVAGLLSAVKRYVSDRSVLSSIQAEFIRLVSQDGSQRLNADRAAE